VAGSHRRNRRTRRRCGPGKQAQTASGRSSASSGRSAASAATQYASPNVGKLNTVLRRKSTPSSALMTWPRWMSSAASVPKQWTPSSCRRVAPCRPGSQGVRLGQVVRAGRASESVCPRGRQRRCGIDRRHPSRSVRRRDARRRRAPLSPLPGRITGALSLACDARADRQRRPCSARAGRCGPARRRLGGARGAGGSGRCRRGRGSSDPCTAARRGHGAFPSLPVWPLAWFAHGLARAGGARLCLLACPRARLLSALGWPRPRLLDSARSPLSLRGGGGRSVAGRPCRRPALLLPFQRRSSCSCSWSCLLSSLSLSEVCVRNSSAVAFSEVVKGPVGGRRPPRKRSKRARMCFMQRAYSGARVASPLRLLRRTSACRSGSPERYAARTHLSRHQA
jgi:hypothetical protein